MKGKVLLFPASGKTVEGAFVGYKGVDQRVVSRNGNMVTLEHGATVDIREVRLLKYFVMNGRQVAELHYSDYDKVKPRDEVEVELHNTFNNAYNGDIVKLIKLPSNKLSICKEVIKPITCVVVNVESKIYTLLTPHGDKVTVRRHCFVNESRANYKQIGKIKDGFQKEYSSTETEE
jgi:hypothetical protein